jgi:UDP:flavonoid glycosyltransferase YjiC (YdhE family)
VKTGKRIVFATFGSLGDLHPYIAIARELTRRGHEAVIATFDGYRAAVEAGGVEFAAMRPSLDALGDKQAVINRLLDPRRGPEYLVRGLFMPGVCESYEDLARAAAGADLLVTHPLAFAGPLLAEKRGLRWVSTVLSPLSLFSAIDPPLFPAAAWLRHVRKLGVAPYRLVFSYVRRMVRRWEEPLYRLRAELGKAKAATMTAALQELLASPGCAARAADIGGEIDREDGARAACDALERAAQAAQSQKA